MYGIAQILWWTKINGQLGVHDVGANVLVINIILITSTFAPTSYHMTVEEHN